MGDQQHATPSQRLTREQIEAWRAWYRDGAGTMLPAGTFDDLCDAAALSTLSEIARITFHGSGEDLATDVHALLSVKERQRFMTKWSEREDEANTANERWKQETRT